MTDTKQQNPNVSEDAADGGIANVEGVPNSIIEGEKLEDGRPPSTNDGGEGQGGPDDDDKATTSNGGPDYPTEEK